MRIKLLRISRTKSFRAFERNLTDCRMPVELFTAFKMVIYRILFRVRVSGESCWPALAPGRAYWASAMMPVRTGDFIVFWNHNRLLVKKTLEVRKDGYEVGSTVSWGLSGGDFGTVRREDVLGKVIRWKAS